MPIKKTDTLAPFDLDQAIIALRLNVSQVAKDTNVPRTYISEFRNGNRRLLPEHQAKLRDYFESKGVEFDADDEKTPSVPTGTLTNSPNSAPYRFWPVYLDVNQSEMIKVLGMVQDNDARLAVLMQQAVAKNDGSWGDGGFSKETTAALQEAFSLLSLNYALFRSLSGWPAFGLTPSNENPQTLRDVIFATFQNEFEKAGLIVAPSDHEVEQEEGAS